MSFSGDVKHELCEQTVPARHCKIAELAAIVGLCGKMTVDKSQEGILKLQTESNALAKRIYLLLKQTFQVTAEIVTHPVMGGKGNLYELLLPEPAAGLVLGGCKLTCNGLTQEYRSAFSVDPIVLMKSCCKRAFIRGAFLAAGSVTNPDKSYHFEIVVGEEGMSSLLCTELQSFGIDAKTISRKQHLVVYVKDGEQISDLLNVMGAHVALMEFENVRILKEVRNSVNRQVNCETANLNKTVKAAGRQIEDIRYIRDHGGFASLSEGLEEIALLRIDYPEASLKELGEMLHPAMGRSGVNHRLKKLCEIAEQLRSKEGAI